MKRPRLFISAVSKELGNARGIVCQTVTHLGFDAISMASFPTGHGELTQWLIAQIDSCEGIIQLVGDTYGAEPRVIDAEFGRISYTQFEFFYAWKKKKKTWIILPGPGCKRDFPVEELDLPEPGIADPAGYQAERRALQQRYLGKLKELNILRHLAADETTLKLLTTELNDELLKLRRLAEIQQWLMMAGVAFILLILVALGIGGFMAYRGLHTAVREIIPVDWPKDSLQITVKSGEHQADLGMGGILDSRGAVLIHSEIPPGYNAGMFLLSGGGKLKRLATLTAGSENRTLSFKGAATGSKLTELVFVCLSRENVPDVASLEGAPELQRPLPLLPKQTLLRLTLSGVTLSGPDVGSSGSRDITDMNTTDDDPISQAERQLAAIRTDLAKQKLIVQGIAFSH